MEQRHLYGTVDYTSLVKARDTLHRILKTSQNEAEKTGVVKAFEICYELSWKIMTKILEFWGVEIGAARDIFREVARLKLLDDAENDFPISPKEISRFMLTKKKF